MDASFYFFVLNIYSKVYLDEKINCLLLPIAELLRWEPGIVFHEIKKSLISELVL